MSRTDRRLRDSHGQRRLRSELREERVSLSEVKRFVHPTLELLAKELF